MKKVRTKDYRPTVEQVESVMVNDLSTFEVTYPDGHKSIISFRRVDLYHPESQLGHRQTGTAWKSVRNKG